MISTKLIEQNHGCYWKHTLANIYVITNTTFSINDKIVTDSKEIANDFNNYFISIGPPLANDIGGSVNHYVLC